MSSAPASPPPRLARWPFVLLGLMTTVTVLGPLLIGWVLRGGASAQWPPDRTVEWATVGGTAGLVALLMLACLSLLWTNRPPIGRPTRPEPPAPAPAPAPGVPR